jgi:predicted ribosome quality control (RQC) complex YloA/Tae2 family protein
MPLILGSFTVTFLAAEIGALIKGAEVRGVYISDDRVLSISLRSPGKRPRTLRFLHAPGFALICADGRDDNEARLTHLPRFESLMEGATVESVDQVDMDRVIRLGLERADGERLALYFELNPSLPNLFLTDGEDVIRAVLLRAGTHTRSRRLEEGRPYAPQPSPCKIPPPEVNEKYLNTLAWWKDERVLSQAVMGVGPFLSREVAHRARAEGSFHAAYEGLMRAYRMLKPAPHTFSVDPPASGKPSSVGIAWYMPQQQGVREVRAAKSLNDAALAVLKSLTAARAFDRRRSQVARALEREIRKWNRVETETRDAASEKQAGLLARKCGELIMANLDGIKKGDTEAVLPDLHEGGRTTVTMSLEPHLSPQANAGVYFKKARKSLRRARLAGEKLKTARASLAALTAVRDELDGLKDARRLTEIEERVLFTTPEARDERPPEDPKAERLGIRPRRYALGGGWTVLVGRSARENDVLTHRYASPSDLWFHARQAQGAHVVLIREKGKPEPSKQVILGAAAIAAYYSKARTSKHVPVSYTEKRYVKKVRKGPPGTAAMLREKVVFVDPRLPAA